jgi:hypothetical protein
MKIRISGAVLLVFGCAILLAQNPPTPRGKATASIGGKAVTIDFGRPALKGRSMDELFKQLPPDRVWRAGQDQVTTLTTEGDIMVGVQKVPAGKYSLYVYVAQTGDWSLILNKDLGIDLIKIWPKAPPNIAREPWPYYQDYTEKIGKQEVVRVAMKSEKLSSPADPFSMELVPGKNGAILKMSWGERSCSVAIAPTK